MKFFERFKNIGIISIGVALLSVCTMVWLTSSPVTSRCVGEESSDSKLYKAHPVKIVIRPWLGQHEVFGIFMVPLRFRSGKRYSGSISVQSYSGAFRPDQQPEVPRIEGVVVEPGSYLVRGYVPTRIALWFLVTGQFGELRSPCNWILEFSERSQ